MHSMLTNLPPICEKTHTKKCKKAGSQHAVVLNQNPSEMPNLSQVSGLFLQAIENSMQMVYIILRSVNVE